MDAFPVIGCVVESALTDALWVVAAVGYWSAVAVRYSLGGWFAGPCGRIATLLPFASEVASAREAAAAV